MIQQKKQTHSIPRRNYTTQQCKAFTMAFQLLNLNINQIINGKGKIPEENLYFIISSRRMDEHEKQYNLFPKQNYQIFRKTTFWSVTHPHNVSFPRKSDLFFVVSAFLSRDSGHFCLFPHF